MRRIRYLVATSLDGYIAGPKGEADWIIGNPEVDFHEIFAQFDTILVGRRTFEPMVAAGRSTMPGIRTVVISTTLRQADHPKVTILGKGWEAKVRALRSDRGKDICLFGGGSLFRSLLAAHLVHTVEVAIIPILLGGGIPLLPSPADRTPLKLTAHKIYKNGSVRLEYAIA